MTDKTFVFTIEDVKAIFNAGVRRGKDEASAYEWGCPTFGWEFDECCDAMEDIVNKNVHWEDPAHIDYNTIKAWFKDA